MIRHTIQMKLVWVEAKVGSPRPYHPATLLTPLSHSSLQCQFTNHLGQSTTSTLTPDEVWQRTEEEESHPDMCQMSVMNQPEVLQNLISRYNRNQIFTNIGPTLLVLNPYQRLNDLYDDNALQRVKQCLMAPGKTGGSVQPHIYEVAGRAYMAVEEGKQAIVISGQSGAGKTQSAKDCMRFLAALSPTHHYKVEQRILACNPVLEAFGNSKTLRNQNSSRFGKYVRILVDSEGLMQGAKIESYLLEKSRVVSVGKGERSFHCFYALTASGLHGMAGNERYAYLRQSECYSCDHFQDSVHFGIINEALKAIGFSEAEIEKIWALVGSVLHLGNIEFDDGLRLNDESRSCRIVNSYHLDQAALLLGLPSQQLSKLLLYQKKRFLSETTLSAYSSPGCMANRDTLAKSIYNSVFEHILARIRAGLAPPQGDYRQISILDIFGFENFEQNGFEQFCINFANERLLQLYNGYVFERQVAVLRQDGLQGRVLGVQPPLNDALVQAINGKLSLFSIVNDMTLPQFKDQHITQGFKKVKTKSLTFDQHRPLRFSLAHSPCSVQYDAGGFKAKNQDKVSDEIRELMSGILGTDGSSHSGKTTLTKFSRQIEQLMAELNSSQVHFVRCIKPNQLKEPSLADERYILTQVRYLGVFQTILVRRNVFPYRRDKDEFRRQMAPMFPEARKQSPQQTLLAVLGALDVPEKDYLIGRRRLYLTLETEQVVKQKMIEFMKVRAEKAVVIQRALMHRVRVRQMTHKLKVLARRVRIWREVIPRWQNQLIRQGWSGLWVSCEQKREEEEKRMEEQRLFLLQEAKRKREEQAARVRVKLEKASKLIHLLARTCDSLALAVAGQCFAELKRQHQVAQSIDKYNKIKNELELVDNVDLPSQTHLPYTKPQTPSTALMGQSLTFNEELMQVLNAQSSSRLFKDSAVAFSKNMVLGKSESGGDLKKLRGILNESPEYKTVIPADKQQQFFSPLSRHARFHFEDLSTDELSAIMDFDAEAVFAQFLRRRTTFLGSSKNYLQILVPKSGGISKPMTVMTSQQLEKEAITCFQIIERMCGENNLQKMVTCVERLLQKCQRVTLQLKNEVFVQLLRQTAGKDEVSNMRAYQAMAVFQHVYSQSPDLLRATLTMLYWRLNEGKRSKTEREYILYLCSLLNRKIHKKVLVGYLPVRDQIVALICCRQITLPVYLPTGSSVVVRAEAASTFLDIKQGCMKAFGIDIGRFRPELFGFAEVVNFEHEQLEQIPIRESNAVWDMVTYWQLTRIKYLESQIKPPSFYLTLRIRYAFECHREDEPAVQICFSNLLFDFFIGKVLLEEEVMFVLGAIIKQLQAPKQTVEQKVMGLLPLWFSKTLPRSQCIVGLKKAEAEVGQMKKIPVQLKYLFVQLCEDSPIALSLHVPTEIEEAAPRLFLKTKTLFLSDMEANFQEIPLKKLLKWSFDKEKFYIDVSSGGEQPRKIVIRTDYASVCNEFLNNLPSIKLPGGQEGASKKKAEQT